VPVDGWPREGRTGDELIITRQVTASVLSKGDCRQRGGDVSSSGRGLRSRGRASKAVSNVETAHDASSVVTWRSRSSRGISPTTRSAAPVSPATRVLATPNHPHIGATYGLEESRGLTALVLELLEGPTLADRLERGPLKTGIQIDGAERVLAPQPKLSCGMMCVARGRLKRG
jgi:hypothetical protein